MRKWLVTALKSDGTFIDQRTIEAPSQQVGESYAYDWIKSKGGDPSRSIIKEV